MDEYQYQSSEVRQLEQCQRCAHLRPRRVSGPAVSRTRHTPAIDATRFLHAIMSGREAAAPAAGQADEGGNKVWGMVKVRRLPQTILRYILTRRSKWSSSMRSPSLVRMPPNVV